MSDKLKNIVAMASFGTIPIFVKRIDLSVIEIAFWRGFIAFFILFGIRKLFYKSQKESIKLKTFLILFSTGMAIGINWALLFWAYDYTSVAIATLSYYFAPIIVIIVAPILFREHITKLQILCFICATIGLVMVIGVGERVTPTMLTGVGLGLGAACLYAGIVLTNKGINEVSGLTRTLIQFAGSSAILFVILIVQDGFQIRELSNIGIINLVILGIYHTGICYWLFFVSVRTLKGQQTAILSYVDPVVAILVSVMVFREPISGIQILGAGFILGFSVLYELVGQKKQ